ncbi:hypothetical protein [Lacrimispora amygdalina]|nr:hypothetical protein [Lacrimispora amygdalina]
MGKHLGRFWEKKLELMNGTKFRSWETFREIPGEEAGTNERN